jgi:hypothetical protein
MGCMSLRNGGVVQRAVEHEENYTHVRSPGFRNDAQDTDGCCNSDKQTKRERK